jgi:hypothetical protein
MNSSSLRIGGLALLQLAAAFPGWSMPLTFRTTAPLPPAVGSRIRWEVSVPGMEPGQIWYRYRVRHPGESRWRTVRDFSPAGAFDWTPMASEGTYELEVTAKNRTSGETQTRTENYSVASRVASGEPVITPTANELVYLYSAPPCPAGSGIAVTFASSDGASTTTPAQECDGDRSTNVYLAGLRAQTVYTVAQTITGPNGEIVTGPAMTLQTNPLTLPFSATTVTRQPSGSPQPGILFQNRVFEPSVATDLQGNIVWYYPERIPYLTRPEPGGYFFALKEQPGLPDHQQLLRQIDLAGNVVWETNAGRINEQLAAMG